MPHQQNSAGQCARLFDSLIDYLIDCGRARKGLAYRAPSGKPRRTRTSFISSYDNWPRKRTGAGSDKLRPGGWGRGPVPPGCTGTEFIVRSSAIRAYSLAVALVQ